VAPALLISKTHLYIHVQELKIKLDAFHSVLKTVDSLEIVNALETIWKFCENFVDVEFFFAVVLLRLLVMPSFVLLFLVSFCC